MVLIIFYHYNSILINLKYYLYGGYPLMIHKLKSLIKKTTTIILLSMTLSVTLYDSCIVENYSEAACCKEVPKAGGLDNSN